MISATVLAVLFVPVFFVFVLRRLERSKEETTSEPADVVQT